MPRLFIIMFLIKYKSVILYYLFSFFIGYYDKWFELKQDINKSLEFQAIEDNDKAGETGTGQTASQRRVLFNRRTGVRKRQPYKDAKNLKVGVVEVNKRERWTSSLHFAYLNIINKKYIHMFLQFA